MLIKCLSVAELNSLTKNEILVEKNMLTFFEDPFLGNYLFKN